MRSRLRSSPRSGTAKNVDVGKTHAARSRSRHGCHWLDAPVVCGLRRPPELSCLGRCRMSKRPHRPFLLRSILKRPFHGLLQTPPIPKERTTGSPSPSGLDGWRCRTHYLQNTVGGRGCTIGDVDPLRNNACSWRSGIVWGECRKFVEKL